jgi:hypothetical protein
MTRVRLQHVTADRDRHGNVRYYFRKRGLKGKTRLPGLPGSKEFMAVYEALLEGHQPPPTKNEPKFAYAAVTSLRWLFEQYLANRSLCANLTSRHLPLADAHSQR